MKKTNTILIVLFSAVMLILSSCNVNKFSYRKNYQPRVRVEVVNTIPSIEKINIEDNIQASKDSISTRNKIKPQTAQHQTFKQRSVSLSNTIKPKETITEKMVTVFFPKKKEIFAPVFHPKKNKLNKVKHTTLNDDEITGLVISLVAFALAATSLFMIIGMAHGNVWVFFVVGFVLATAAIIMAFIANKTLPFKGISLGAGMLGILSLILILIFLLLITVVKVIF